MSSRRVKRGRESSALFPIERTLFPIERRQKNGRAATLEEKLAEVLGLAQAAQGATEKVEDMIEDEGIVATAILEKAQETKAEATEMMSTYLGGDSEGLDGFEFLTMAEAGEVGHWAVLGKLNESAQESEISELVEWALPIQERHFTSVKDGSLKLAG
jgi:hypothetical protein